MSLYTFENRIGKLFARDSALDNLVWRAIIARRDIAHNARYRSPVVRAFRALVERAKPFGEISGGSDCDGMRMAGMSLHWTRASAQAALDEGCYHAEGPWGGEVVSGREAREWAADYEPDTRDRYAEAMNY